MVGGRMVRRIKILFIMGVSVFFVLACGKKGQGPEQAELTNDQRIRAKFETFKNGYQNKDINGMMSVISSNYRDNYNRSKAEFKTWLQSYLSGKEWVSPPQMEIKGDIDIHVGYMDMETHQFHPTSATANVEAFLSMKETSENVLTSTSLKLRMSWQLEEQTTEWWMTRVSGPTANLGTSPISVAPNSLITVFAYTLPFGAPLQNYDTQSVSVKDWNNNSVSLDKDAIKLLYSGSLTAPSTAGNYTLTATLKDTTENKVLTVIHTFTVQ